MSAARKPEAPSLLEAPYPAPPGVVYLWASKRGAICPRCSTFIGATSKVVRLRRPERPNTEDGRTAPEGPGRPLGPYYADGREIRLQPRWWVHERCWRAGHRQPPRDGRTDV